MVCACEGALDHVRVFSDIVLECVFLLVRHARARVCSVVVCASVRVPMEGWVGGWVGGWVRSVNEQALKTHNKHSGRQTETKCKQSMCNQIIPVSAR